MIRCACGRKLDEFVRPARGRGHINTTSIRDEDYDYITSPFVRLHEGKGEASARVYPAIGGPGSLMVGRAIKSGQQVKVSGQTYPSCLFYSCPCLRRWQLSRNYPYELTLAN